MEYRIGQGYDVHAIAAGLPMWLGGVQIPSEKGFVAHSDGDVAIHALCDALLGALRTLYPAPGADSAFYAMLPAIEAQQYFPTFIGINDDGGRTECKLYFQSALFGTKLPQKFAAQNAAAVRTLSLDVLTDDLLDFAAAHQLWAEGIAVSFDEPDRIRLYWREL